MKEKSRTYNSIVNSLFGIFAAVVTVVINFAVRIFIVRALGEEINGLHNLFQNTINVLALVESGIVSAMIIHLYEPVKDKNEEQIKMLMQFYRKMYLLIALAFIVIGIVVDIFFMDHLVTSTISSWRVKLYFIVFSLSFFFNYLTYYKRSLLYANQKNRISIMATALGEVLFRGLAIVVAVISHEYLYFLIILIVEKIFSNCICIAYVNKNYPYLKSKKVKELSQEKKNDIFKTIKPLLVNQIANTVQKSANSILISILLGNIAIVGYYGNYQLVVSTVELLFSQIGAAFTSSFGNLAAEKDKTRMYNVYRKSSFVIGFLAVIFCAGFLACIQDFIELVFGTQFVLAYSAAVILVVALYIYLINIPVISVQNAMGLHKKDAKMMIVQAATAVLLGYIGGYYWGMNGILIGLNLPTVVFTLFYKGIVINKTAFDVNAIKYLKTVGFDFVKGMIICVITAYISLNIETQHLFINILIKGVIAVLIAFVSWSAFSFKNQYYKELLSTVFSKLGRNK